MRQQHSSFFILGDGVATTYYIGAGRRLYLRPIIKVDSVYQNAEAFFYRKACLMQQSVNALLAEMELATASWKLKTSLSGAVR